LKQLSFHGQRPQIVIIQSNYEPAAIECRVLAPLLELHLVDNSATNKYPKATTILGKSPRQLIKLRIATIG
jgi:hypothetical protein